MNLLPLVAILPVVLAQSEIDYQISFDNAVHHEARIEVTFPGLPPGRLEVRMSRSSPGRYALHEFAKNVYSVRAFDGDGNELQIERPNPHQWDVPAHDGYVRLAYTLYADHPDGTYSGIDETHAHLNMPATFMWARGLRDRPISITFRPPRGSGWKVATQLTPTGDPMRFTAPDLDYFMDSPTELSDFTLREWRVASNGGSYVMRMAVHHSGSEAEVDAYVEKVRAVVREERAVYGELPRFDYGTYTFIADYLPYVFGDAMEHRNSTFLVSSASLERAAARLIGAVAHEFFHAWNVERIRPHALEPFDFERANMSRELWFAEGFTSYYGPLSMRRAGLMDDAEYARRILGGLGYVINSPGRQFFSPVEMSMQAPFVDAARSVDETNRANTFISYYTWGAALGLGLDLTLRTRFDGLDLDDFMRAVWAKHGKTEIPYTVEDLQRILGELTGDRQFAESFFRNYVYGRDVPDYEELLSHAGLALRKADPGRAVIGRAQLRYGDGGAEVRSNTVIGSPLYRAGVDRGDRILSIDGRRIRSAKDLLDVLAAHRPGDTVPIEFEGRAGIKSASISLAESDRLEVVPYEAAGLALTEEMRAFRESWLGSKAR